MTMEQTTNIKEIITGSESFVLISSEKTPEESLLAKEALSATIRSKGMKIYKLPEGSRFAALDKWQKILPSFEESSFLHSTSILLPKNKINLKEISYSEENGYVSININSAVDMVKKEDVVFRHNPLKADVAFYFAGANEEVSPETLFQDLSKKILLPGKENIILMTEGEETISEKTFDIIKMIDAEGSYEETMVPSLLLASLLVETNNLSGDLRSENLDLASTLIKMRADKSVIRSVLVKEDNQQLNRLFGRALARMTINEPLKSVWSFLSFLDFEKSGVEENDYETIYKVILKIRDVVNSQKAIFLVWQDKQENVRAAIYTKSTKEISDKLQIRLPAENKNNLLVSGPYKSFSEAEIKIKEVLKEII